jgi:hypothetical protein
MWSSEQPEKPNWPMAKADTPNDGLPPHWAPIEEPPIIVGRAPESGPPAYPYQGAGKYFAASIPPVMQLQTDLAITGYQAGLGGYRVMPPGANASASANSAAQSATGNK